MDQTKTCRKCGQTFPMTGDHFFRSSASPDGFATKCKTCYRTAPDARGTGSARKAAAAKPRVVVTSTGYVATPTLMAKVAASWASRDEAGHPPALFFIGPSGSGKTEGARYVAESAGVDFTKVDAPAMTDPESWFGTREVIARDGVPVTIYNPSVFVEAIQKPGVLLLDEMNRIRDEGRQILNPLLDGTHAVTNPLTGETIAKHPDCLIIMSGNVGIQFTGTFAIDPSLRTRALTVPFAYLDPAAEVGVAIDRTGVDRATAEVFVRFANESRTLSENNPDLLPISTREVLWACRLVKNGLSADDAADAAIIDGASDEGGEASAQADLRRIWGGIRPGAGA